MKRILPLFLSVLASHSVMASPTCDQMEFLITKMNLHSSNIANAETTRTPDGGPFKKLELVNCSGWRCEIASVDRFRLVYLPTHADADELGYVKKPEIDTVVEIESLIETQKAYETLIATAQSDANDCRNFKK